VRTVVGVLVEVRGRAHPQAAIRGLTLSALAGTQVPSVVVALANTGLKLCKPTLAVTLAGLTGAQPTVTRDLDTVLPGDEIPYPLAWPRALAAGGYAAVVTASGCGATVTYRSLLRLGGSLSGTVAHPGGLSLSSTQSGANSTWMPIASAVGGGLVLGVVALFLWLLLARRRRRWDEEPRPARS